MFVSNKIKFVVIALVLLVAGLIGYQLLAKPAAPEFTLLEGINSIELVDDAQTDDEKADPDLIQAPTKVLVDIKGAIERPGVYELPADARVIDVVDLAGGLLADADTYQVNMASIIYDAMEIIIPKKGEIIKSKTVDVSGQSVTVGKINLNTANLSQLISLAGIGEVKAQAIISYREQHGQFQKIEDLMRVSGIGATTFAIIKDLISV